ncbi:hypothetical protein [Gottfriedia luciferensis]|uniref:hypothetical protein n=1 Tax=Gottfriedia luciferensis TaxID=178774 RepID=UPI000B441F21|nr:hypothetical protein [Gottfriedia luciferensis]
MDKVLNNLYKDTILALESQNFNIFEENIFIKYEVLKKVINESHSPSESEIYKSLLNYLDLIYAKLIQIGQEEKAIDNINKVYNIVNSSNHNNLFLYFSESMNIFIQNMKEYRFSQLLQLPLNTLIYQIVANIGLKDGEILIDNNISYLIGNMYDSIISNKILENTEQKYLLDRILEDVFYFQAYNKSGSIEQVIYKTLINILLKMIMKKDMLSLRSAIEIIKIRKIHVEDQLISKIFLTMSSYLYYLVYKESIDDNEREKYKSILTIMKNNLIENLTFYYNTDFWTHYKEVKDELRRWEIIGLDVKWLMMESVIIEYFLFLTVVNDLEITEIDKEILTEEEVFNVINTYFNRNKISESLVSQYQKFVEGFSNENRNIMNDMEKLKDEIFVIYKYFRFKDVKEESQKESQIKNNLEIILKEVRKRIKEIPVVQGMKEILKGQEETHFLTYNINIPIIFLSKKNSFSFNSFIDNILKYYEGMFLKYLIQSGVIYKSLLIQDRQKIKSLLDLVKGYKKDSSKINVFISGIEPNSTFLYLEDEESKKLYEELTKEVEKYLLTNNRYWLGIDNNTISINVVDCEVKLIKMSESEIQEQLLKLDEENEMYLINVTNDIYLPFSIDEAKEYLFLNNIKIQIIVQIILMKNEEVSGFVMDIKYDK